MAEESKLEHRLAIYAGIGTLAALVCAALLWLFSVDSKAQYAKDGVDKHEKVLQDKADKADMKDGFDRIENKLDKLTDYLLNNDGNYDDKHTPKVRRVQ